MDRTVLIAIGARHTTYTVLSDTGIRGNTDYNDTAFIKNPLKT